MKTVATKTVTIQAKTVDQALKDAASNLGIGTEFLEYELISRTDTGLLSFLGGKKVEIKAWPKDPSPTRTAADELPALDDKTLADLVDDLRQFCAGICGFIAGEEVEVQASVQEDRLTLNIDNEAVANQIGKNSRLAEAMEHVLRKKPRYLKRELPFRIFVDARGIRSDRELELVDMAKDLSDKVAENQRPIVLNYKSAYDRKIIHMALDKDDKVYTKSIGSGANRKLMILPVKRDEAQS